MFSVIYQKKKKTKRIQEKEIYIRQCIIYRDICIQCDRLIAIFRHTCRYLAVSVDPIDVLLVLNFPFGFYSVHNIYYDLFNVPINALKSIGWFPQHPIGHQYLDNIHFSNMNIQLKQTAFFPCTPSLHLTLLSFEEVSFCCLVLSHCQQFVELIFKPFLHSSPEKLALLFHNAKLLIGLNCWLCFGTFTTSQFSHPSIQMIWLCKLDNAIFQGGFPLFYAFV